MKKLIHKLTKRFFCHFCLEEGKYRLAKTYGRFPIDADYSKEDNCVYPVYDNVGLCAGHLWDYENREGVYGRDY